MRELAFCIAIVCLAGIAVAWCGCTISDDCTLVLKRHEFLYRFPECVRECTGGEQCPVTTSCATPACGIDGTCICGAPE